MLIDFCNKFIWLAKIVFIFITMNSKHKKYHLKKLIKKEYRNQKRLKKTNQPIIIGYLPAEACGWILEYLFQDLSSYFKNYGYVLCKSPLEVFIESHNRSYHIVSLSQLFIQDLGNFCFNKKMISSFYTHSRLNQSNFAKLSEIKNILPMNNTEGAYLNLEMETDTNINVFPLGFDNKIFFNKFLKTEEKDIDILIVQRYIKDEKSYYFKRKNCSLTKDLIFLLNKELNIKVLGKGWEFSDVPKDLIINDISYKNFPNLYNRTKIFLNLSLIEGGPISLLESLACGCITITFPTGFILDYDLRDLNSYIIPQNSKKLKISEIIKNILNKYEPITRLEQQKRDLQIYKSSFEFLSQELIRILNKQ